MLVTAEVYVDRCCYGIEGCLLAHCRLAYMNIYDHFVPRVCVCVACSFGLIYVSEIAAVRFHWTRLNICTHTHVRVHMHGFNGLLSGEPALSLVVPSILGSDYCSQSICHSSLDVCAPTPST